MEIKEEGLKKRARKILGLASKNGISKEESKNG